MTGRTIRFIAHLERGLGRDEKAVALLDGLTEDLFRQSLEYVGTVDIDTP